MALLRRDCAICTRSLGPSAFPKGPTTSACPAEHKRNTCRTCLREWLDTQLKTKTIDQARCPMCKAGLRGDDVKRFATPEVHQRFVEMEYRFVSNNTPGWRWCLAPGCKRGGVHAPLAEHGPWKNIFECPSCHAKACVRCDRPWHEGKSCEEFQVELRKRALADEKATEETITRNCKKCPTCKKNIEKNMGCDHMICTQCNTSFCWQCLLPYSQINRRGHGPACRYGTRGAIDPHAANINQQLDGAGDVNPHPNQDHPNQDQNQDAIHAAAAAAPANNADRPGNPARGGGLPHDPFDIDYLFQDPVPRPGQPAAGFVGDLHARQPAAAPNNLNFDIPLVYNDNVVNTNGNNGGNNNNRPHENHNARAMRGANFGPPPPFRVNNEAPAAYLPPNREPNIRQQGADHQAARGVRNMPFINNNDYNHNGLVEYNLDVEDNFNFDAFLADEGLDFDAGGKYHGIQDEFPRHDPGVLQRSAAYGADFQMEGAAYLDPLFDLNFPATTPWFNGPAGAGGEYTMEQPFQAPGEQARRKGAGAQGRGRLY